MLHNRHSFIQNSRNSIATNTLRLFVILVFLGLFMVSPAFGQADYSTIWFDDSHGDEGTGIVVGAGVTENDYTSDMIEIETTLIGPDGRTITGGTFDYTSGRVEVSLAGGFNMLGAWRVYTTHSSLCSDGGNDGQILTAWNPRLGIIYMTPGYTRCSERNTFADRRLDYGGEDTLEYRLVGPVTTKLCGYTICHDSLDKFCYNGRRERQNYASKEYSSLINPGVEKSARWRFFNASYSPTSNGAKSMDNPCWNYLVIDYLEVLVYGVPVGCLHVWTTPTDYTPPDCMN